MVQLHKPSKLPLWRNPGNKLFSEKRWSFRSRPPTSERKCATHVLSRRAKTSQLSVGALHDNWLRPDWCIFFIFSSIWVTRSGSESLQLNTEKTAPGGMIKVKLSPSVFGKDLVVRMPRYWIDTYIFENSRLISQTAPKTDGYVLSCKSIARRPQVYHSDPRKQD